MSFIWSLILDEEVEEMESEAKTILYRERRRLRDSSNILDLDQIRFKKLFRLSKEAVIDLLTELEPRMNESQRSFAIPSILKLACLLRFCAEGAYQTGVGNDYHLGLAQSTVSTVLSELLEIFERYVCAKWINFEYTREEEDEAKSFFYTKSGIPGIIGCIDGTHIKIRAPAKQHQHLYYNRKGYYSINAMLVCDHKNKIRYVNAKSAGASHDSHVFNMSRLKDILEEKKTNGMTNTWILGDAGYPLCSYLITPFRNTEEGSREALFNKKHSKARIIIEQTIGILKNRFRCLLGARELHYEPNKCKKIINTCVALHNICIYYKVELEEAIEPTEIQHEEEGGRAINEEGDGNTIRDRILNSLL